MEWKDGFLATVLMAIMSTILTSIMAIWSWCMVRNDEEKPKVMTKLIMASNVMILANTSAAKLHLISHLCHSNTAFFDVDSTWQENVYTI